MNVSKYLRWYMFILMSALWACHSNKKIQNNNEPWNGKQAAIILTYDDGLNQHLDNALPALNKLALKGTFYLADFGNLKQQIPGWRAAAAKGHELGNHTIYHPCIGDRPGREFVKPETNLNNYTIRRITDEIKTMNTLLFAIDGKEQRTFAYPCSDTKINDKPYIDGVRNEFVAVRAVRSEMPTLNNVDVNNLPCYMVNGETGDQLIKLVDKAIENKALLIFLFHGVGGGNALNVSVESHKQLLTYLKQQQQKLWVPTIIEMAKYVKQHKNTHNN